jgi:hypothetical protein
MPLDLTGIQNTGEFYSHHYLDLLLEQDLKGLLARWRTDDQEVRMACRRHYDAAPFFDFPAASAMLNALGCPLQ